MEAFVTLLAAAALLGLGYSLVVGWRFWAAARRPGIGRIFYLSLISLKSWAGLVLLYFLLNTNAPSIFGDGGINEPPRLYIRLFLALYLIAQPLGVSIALHRWRKSGGTRENQHPQENRGNSTKPLAAPTQD